MLKMILLAGTVIVAGPAAAQTSASVGQTAPRTVKVSPAPDATVPQQTAPAQAPAMTTPPAALAQPTPTPTPTPMPTPTPTSTPSAAASTPSQAQVAQVVEQQFATYDKDGNGSLSKAEFATWMTALKAQANAKAATPAEETAWNDAAFTQADGDKSATVTKAELTGFLVRGASGQS